MRILIAIIIAILTALLGVGHPAEEVSVTPIEPVVKAETAVAEECGNMGEAVTETDPPLMERPEETPTVEFVVPTVEIPPEATPEPETTVHQTEVPVTPDPSFMPPEPVEMNITSDIEDADEIQEETDTSASFRIEPEMYVEELPLQIDEPLQQVAPGGDDPDLLPIVVGEIIVESDFTYEIESNQEQDAINGNAPVYVSPIHGGPNPFDDDTPTVVDEHSVEEFIGEGDDRPGEGIHF
ncbi:MAG: hypothetical protein K6G89_04220 [Clostridia bacterium]|nr:hypothetical protein [Clostridia bacterium]